MADNGTWIPSTGTITPDSPTNVSAVVFYNELATLMLNTGKMAAAVAVVVFSLCCFQLVVCELHNRYDDAQPAAVTVYSAGGAVRFGR
jgi:hypothetical protein